jgi:hypothetical protein
MAKAHIHAESSARRWGGVAADYIDIHTDGTVTVNHLGNPSTQPGMRYGKLTVVELLPPVNCGSYWKRPAKCVCDCGREKTVTLNNLRVGNSKSCGKCVRQMNSGCTKPLGVANANGAFAGCKRGAASRGLTFDIDFDDFYRLSQLPCHYCGRVRMNRFEVRYAKGEKAGKPRCNGAFEYNGLDRVDPSIGYNLANCVPCCYQCNIAKSDYSQDEFLGWLELAYQHTRGLRGG